MAKHSLKVANGRELVEGEDYILFECSNCDKKIGFTGEAISAILTEGDQRLVGSDLGEWAKCGGHVHH